MATASCGNVTVNGYRFFNDSWSSPTYATIAASYCRTGGKPDYVTVDKITLPSFTNAKFVAPYTLSYTLDMARGSQDTQTTSGTLTVHVYTSDPGGESLYSKTPSPTNPPSGYIGSGSLSYSGLNDGYKSFTINNINISNTDLSAGGVYYLWIQTTSLTKVHNSKPSGSLTGTLASFSIKYDANGGSGAPDSQTKTYGTTLTLRPNEPTRTGYTFKGWATSKTATTASYQPGGSYTDNAGTTLYAVWEINKYKLYIYPDGGTWNGKTGDQTIKIAYQGTQSMPVPTKNGYTFAGWAWSAHGTMNNSLANSILTSNDGSIKVYNNKGNGSVTHTFIADASDKGKYSNDYIKITKTSAEASPGLGGFSRTRASELNATYYHTFYAKLPTGYYFSRHQNTMPTGTEYEWLTDTKGTGAWKLYSYKIKMGSSDPVGNTFGYVAANADSGSSTATVTWYLGANQITKSPTTAQTFTAGAGDTWMYALWVPNKYTVTYDSNGGSGSIAADTVYYGSSYTTKSNSFERTGYTFNGWNTKSDGSGTSYSAGGSISNISAAVTLYAQWKPISYTITYTLDGGTVSGNPTSYTIETAAFTLKNPTKQNYTFNGWTGSNGSTPQTEVTIKKGSTGNKSYTANWTLNTAKYTVKHWQQKVNATSTTNNSTNYAEVTADRETPSGIIGSSVTPAVKTYTGFKSPDKKTVTIKADGSTTVNYYYTRNSYDLTLEKGTGISNVTGGGSKKYDASVSIGATVLTGYTWKNWTGYSTTTTQSYQFNMPANDVTYTANATPITYTVAFNRNGGSYSTMQNQTFTYDVAQKLSKNTFTKNGYSFAGWATSQNGSVVYTDQQEVKNLRNSTGTTTLYAVWKQKFTVTYNVNDGTGGSISSATVNSGDNHIVSSTILTKTVQENGATATFYHNDGTENYTSVTAQDTVTYNLSYWTDNKGNEYDPGATITNVTSNITLTANYEDKKSTTYGNITAPSNLSRTGYALSGYSIDPGFYTIKREPGKSFQLIADENLYAVWSPNVYNMTIDPNGGQIFNCEAYTSEIINTKFSYNTKTYIGTAIRDKIYGPKISDSTISKTLGTASSSSRFSITIQYASDIEEITSQNDTIALSNPTTSSTLTTLTQCQNIFSNGGKYILLDNVVYYVENSDALSQTYSNRRYTITCNVNPISIVETGTVISNYSKNNSAIKEGYVFEGYEATAGNVALHTNEDYFYFEGENPTSYAGRGLISNGTYVFDGNATGNVTITAQFRKKNYTVQYELNNSKITDQSSFSEVHDYGDTFTLPSFATTQIYEFLGWNTAADGSGTAYNIGSQVSNLSDVDGATFTLYAQWKLKNLVQVHHGGKFENAQMFVWTNNQWTLATTYVWKSGDWAMSTGK